MKVGNIRQQRLVRAPDNYRQSEIEDLIEKMLNVHREFKVGYYWENNNEIKIFFAPHEQYAEQLTDNFVDEQVDYLKSLLQTQ